MIRVLLLLFLLHIINAMLLYTCNSMIVEGGISSGYLSAIQSHSIRRVEK